MSEFDPTTLKDDELYLAGRLQIDIAHTALALTSLNHPAQRKLQTFLDLHGTLGALNEKSAGSETSTRSSLNVYLQGGETTAMKADILTALRQVANDESRLPEDRANAQALLSILTTTPEQ